MCKELQRILTAVWVLWKLWTWLQGMAPRCPRHWVGAPSARMTWHSDVSQQMDQCCALEWGLCQGTLLLTWRGLHPRGTEEAVSGSPEWSQIAKRGRQHISANAGAKPRLRTATSRQKKKSGTSTVGTGAAGNIKTVKTKLVSVFACKFLPAEDEEALSGYCSEKPGRVVSCSRIGNENGRYSSFKVFAECHDIGEMYNL